MRSLRTGGIMNHRQLNAVLCLTVVAAAACIGTLSVRGKAAPDRWQEVVPGVFRSPGFPAGYALVDGEAALLIDAPAAAETWKELGVRSVDAVLLTHHHRDACAAAGRLLAAGIKVKAPRAAAEWLTPANVRKYWQEALPLRNSRT